MNELNAINRITKKKQNGKIRQDLLLHKRDNRYMKTFIHENVLHENVSEHAF